MEMLWNEVVDKYGEEMAGKIIESDYLIGITVRYDDDLNVHIYEHDIEHIVKLITDGERK